MAELSTGLRVKARADYSQVGTILKINRTTADVEWDRGETTKISLDAIQPKGRGRTRTGFGDATTPPRVAYRNVTNTVIGAAVDRLGWTRRMLAERSGLDERTIYRLLRGEVERVPVSTLESVATALGLSPSDFWVTDGGR